MYQISLKSNNYLVLKTRKSVLDCYVLIKKEIIEILQKINNGLVDIDQRNNDIKFDLNRTVFTSTGHKNGFTNMCL